MSQDNFVSVTGNLTRDPELRYSASGVAMATFGVAHNDRRFRDGKWEDGDTSFFNVVCFRSIAENLAASVNKGVRVTVTGRLRWRSWEDKDSGEKRSAVEIVAEEVSPSLLFASVDVVKSPVSKSSSTSDYIPPPTDEEPF